jgi:hypothetical protein
MSAHSGIDPELQQVIDTLCNDGCKAVSSYILAIEAGEYPACMQSLTEAEQQKVLAELKSIMAVYDRCGD